MWTDRKLILGEARPTKYFFKITLYHKNNFTHDKLNIISQAGPSTPADAGPSRRAALASEAGSSRQATLPTPSVTGPSRRPSLLTPPEAGPSRQASLPTPPEAGSSHRASLPTPPEAGPSRRATLPTPPEAGPSRRATLPTPSRRASLPTPPEAGPSRRAPLPTPSRRPCLLSATTRKFSYTSVETGVDLLPDDDSPPSTLLVRSAVLSSLVEKLACTLCGCCTLIIRPVDVGLGMVCELQTYCTSCEETINTTQSSDRIGGIKSSSAPFVVTRSAVAATVDAGVGHAGLVKFCRYLDMPVVHHKTYQKHVNAITTARTEVARAMLDEAAHIVRKAYRLTDPSINDNTVIDIAVSYDGSWMTRGHRSHYGIGCVVEVLTGLVVDYHVMSLFCQSCAHAASRFGSKTTPEFLQWHAEHTECNCNYSGSSGAMEMTAAAILWKRSVEHYKFRYTTMVSDGDASTFRHLSDIPDLYNVVKEECINHVGKRMGTALRKLATEGKKAGTVLGGRGYGKLTQGTINKLTGYYSKAIRSHPGDLDGMRDAVFATLFHAASTDDNPRHFKCPQGSASWCFFNRAEAAGEEPVPHSEGVGTPLSAEVVEHLQEVYLRLGHPDLLRRCLRGVTQNANESLHSKVWTKCPKTGFVGMLRVIGATCAAISEFNQGVASSVARVYEAMGLKRGSCLKASAEKADYRRERDAHRRSLQRSKAARRARKLTLARAQDSAYKAGAF